MIRCLSDVRAHLFSCKNRKIPRRTSQTTQTLHRKLKSPIALHRLILFHTLLLVGPTTYVDLLLRLRVCSRMHSDDVSHVILAFPSVVSFSVCFSPLPLLLKHPLFFFFSSISTFLFAFRTTFSSLSWTMSFDTPSSSILPFSFLEILRQLRVLPHRYRA